MTDRVIKKLSEFGEGFKHHHENYEASAISAIRETGGVWTFGEPGGLSYQKREDPWTQAKGTMFAVRQKLVEADSAFEDILDGFGVVMPMETFTTTGAEIEPAVLLDRREFRTNLGYYIGRLQRHWIATYQAKHGRTPRLPTKSSAPRRRKSAPIRAPHQPSCAGQKSRHEFARSKLDDCSSCIDCAGGRSRPERVPFTAT